MVLWLAVGFTYAQTTSTKSIKLDEKSIVKDAEGSIYPFAIWKKLIETGEYNVKSISGAEDNEFLLYRLTEEEIAVRKKKEQS